MKLSGVLLLAGGLSRGALNQLGAMAKEDCKKLSDGNLECKKVACKLLDDDQQECAEVEQLYHPDGYILKSSEVKKIYGSDGLVLKEKSSSVNLRSIGQLNEEEFAQVEARAEGSTYTVSHWGSDSLG